MRGSSGDGPGEVAERRFARWPGRGWQAAGVARSPFDREIVRLAVPALATLLAEPLYILADTAVVGHLGTPQLAGLAVASSILLTAVGLCVFLAYGTTAAVARLIGAGDHQEAAHQGVQGLWLGLLIGLALGASRRSVRRPVGGARSAPRARWPTTPGSTCASARSACPSCCSRWPGPATCAACRTR